MDKKKPIILSLGGSLVVPQGGIDVEFVKQFHIFIKDKVGEGYKFFIVVGGGTTARHYIEAAKKITGTISDWDLDWLGIHTTRLNAHLIKTVFEGIVHPRVIANYRKKITTLKEPVVIAAGWEPGWSTDYDAVTLAKDYGAKMLFNLSNISQVYDSDPKKNPDAKPIEKITWKKYREMVGDAWTPGSNTPFDPVASKIAMEHKLKVIILNGKDLKNLDNAIQGREFLGSVIEP
jgi:uridylate kinase